MRAWASHPEIGLVILRKLMDADERVRKLIDAKIAIERSYNEKIAVERKRINRLNALYKRKCRCVVMVRKFDGYPRFGGRARYVQRQCLNSALPGEYICGVHVRARKTQARMATEAEIA